MSDMFNRNLTGLTDKLHLQSAILCQILPWLVHRYGFMTPKIWKLRNCKYIGCVTAFRLS